MKDILFEGFPKMARLSRDIIITEKIDGTNAQIYITEDYQIFSGSRTRWITLQDDNFGFASWVNNNKEELLTLGPGRHFGEWWGKGIQRGYNLAEKRFSLFNVERWCEYDAVPQRRNDANYGAVKLQDVLPKIVSLVPKLWEGKFSTEEVETTLDLLVKSGSHASPGFMKPEGIVIFHTTANFGFKKTIEKDEVPKSLIKT